MTPVYELTYPAGGLPSVAQTPKGRPNPAWKSALASVPHDGTWHQIGTYGKSTAYQLALRLSTARHLGGTSWRFASIESADESFLYASWAP